MEALLLNLEIELFMLMEPAILPKNLQGNVNYFSGNLRGQYAASWS